MNPSPSASLGQRIRQERLRLGWTQARTAAAAGQSTRTYARFEREGRTSVEHLLRIVAALGLRLDLTAAPDSGVVPDPRATNPRQRGVRQPNPTPAPRPAQPARPSQSAQPATPAEPATPAQYRPPALPETLPETDAATIATAAKKYRDSVSRLAGSIVRGRLTNWTAAQLVRNFLASNAVPEADQPAYVGAVLAVLAQLSPDNIAVYGAEPAQLEAWKPGWHFDQPIHGALD